MSNNGIEPYIKITNSVIETMTTVKPQVGEAYVKPDHKTWGVVTSMISFASENINGYLSISFDEPAALEIVSKMLYEEFKAIDAAVVDAVGELANMLMGGMKREFSEKGLTFQMTTPMMLTGKNIELSPLSKAPVTVIPFHTETGGFVIETNVLVD